MSRFNVPTRRSMIGLVMAALMLPAVLSLMACLNVPVGDPDLSKIDPALTGAWVYKPPGGDGNEQLYIVRPFDKHSYLVQGFAYKTPGVVDTDGSASYKAWLTKLGTGTFITLEPIRHGVDLGVREDKDRFWVVGRVDVEGSTLELHLITAESPLIKEKEPKTREAVEEIISANVQTPDLYKDTVTLKKADPDKIRAVLEAFKVD